MHDLQQYHSVVIGGNLRGPAKQPVSKGQLYTALHTIVQQLPSLALQIHRVNGVYSFVLAEEVDLDKQVYWHENPFKTDTELMQFRQDQISKQFEQIDKIPPWRLLVSPVEGGSQVSFFFHHSLMDGTGATHVLFSLARELSAEPATLPSSVVQIPSSAQIPPNVEASIELSVTPEAKAEFEADQNKPYSADLWTANTIYGVQEESLYSKALLHTTSAEDMATLLTQCRKNGVTVTTLLIAVLFYATDKVLGSTTDKTKFLCTVPQNLRTVIDKSPDAPVRMGDYVTATVLPYTRKHGAVTPTRPDFDLIWETAKEGRKTLLEKAINITATTPNLGIAFLPFVGDIYTMFKELVENQSPRDHTYEFSSIVLPSSASNWTLQDPIFIQGCGKTGPAALVSAISYKGGAQTVSFSYASETIEDGIVKGVVDQFGDLIGQICSAAT